MTIYVVIVTSIIAVFLSSASRKPSLILIAIGFLTAGVLLALDSQLLFYHALALNGLSGLVLLLYTWLTRSTISSRQLVSSILILAPFLIVWLFKGLHLQGLDFLLYSLIISIASFVYFTFERRTWDALWILLLIPTIWSLSPLIGM